MVKKKIPKEIEKVNEKGDCNWACVKLAAMAFILFLVTVWPAVGNWLLGVPWWVYLIIFVVLGVAGMKKAHWCCKK